MHLTLIQPPIEDFYSTPIRRQPLGLLQLAAVAMEENWEVQLINGHSPKKKIIPLPEQLHYLRPYMEEKNDLPPFPFKHFYHFGISFQEIERQIKNTNTDLFCVSSMFTPYHNEMEQILFFIREHHPHTPIVIGGGHATIHSNFYMKSGLTDYLILGEGELPFRALIQNLKRETKPGDIPGLLHRDNLKEERRSPVKEIDQLPIPARHLLRERDFRIYKQKGTSLLYSRGCPNNCRFCTGRYIFPQPYRQRTTAHLINEINDCYQHFGLTFFNFEDDNLFAIQKQAVILLNSLISWQQENNISLDMAAMNGISIEKLTPELVDLMQKAGFKELNVSLVTAGSLLQEELGRPGDNNHFKNIVKRAYKLGMNVRAYFILGLPEQTEEEIMDTVNLLTQLKVKAIPSVYYDVLRPHKEDWMIQRSSAFANETEYLSRRKLISLFNQIVFDDH